MRPDVHSINRGCVVNKQITKILGLKSIKHRCLIHVDLRVFAFYANTRARRLTCNRRLEASIVVNSDLVEDIVLTIVDVVVLVIRTSYQCTVKDVRVRTIEVIVVPVAWSRKVRAGTESETENESETESENENGGESETMSSIFRIQYPMKWLHIDGLVQERRNSIANTQELRLSCTNPSMRWTTLSKVIWWAGNVENVFIVITSPYVPRQQCRLC